MIYSSGKSLIRMGKLFLWHIDCAVIRNLPFHFTQQFAHAWAVITLQDYRNKVVENSIGNHRPAKCSIVPQEEENARKHHNPMANLSPDALLQPALQVSRIICRQVFDGKCAAIERRAVWDQVFPGTNMK